MPMGQPSFDVQKVADRIQERSEKGEFNFSFFITFIIIIVVILSAMGKVFKFADWFSGIDRDKKNH